MSQANWEGFKISERGIANYNGSYTGLLCKIAISRQKCRIFNNMGTHSSYNWSKPLLTTLSHISNILAVSPLLSSVACTQNLEWTCNPLILQIMLYQWLETSLNSTHDADVHFICLLYVATESIRNGSVWAWIRHLLTINSWSCTQFSATVSR